MESLKQERLEELVIGWITETLNDEEIDEFNILAQEYGNIEKLKENYISLINTIELIPTTKASKELGDRIIATSQLRDSNNYGVSITKILMLVLASISGYLLFQINGYNTKYATNKNQEIEINKSVFKANYRNKFELIPAKANSLNKDYMNASVLIRPKMPTNLLTVKGLPDLAPGLTYRLWAYTDIGPQGCVSFLPDKDGNVKIPVPSEPTKSAISVIITIDQVIPGSLQDSPGEKVLISI